jgi:hypothetical protein
MIDNWNAERPPSQTGMQRNSSNDGTSAARGVIIFFLLVAIIGPIGIIIRRHYFSRDDRERKEPEHTVTFPDPMMLPNFVRKHCFSRDDREQKEPEHTVTFPDPMMLPSTNAFA